LSFSREHIAGPYHSQAKLLTRQPGLQSIQATNDFRSYLGNISESAYVADIKTIQEGMAALHTVRRQNIVRFRSDIAALAATVGRSVQLGLASKLLMRLHGALVAECDGQEALNALDQQISKLGSRIAGLGPRNTRGKDGIAAMDLLLTEVKRLQAEKEKAEEEQEKVVGRRVKIEKELEGMECNCQARMCKKCLELLRQCEECEEAGVAWEKMSTK
jgi:hypothetical protein